MYEKNINIIMGNQIATSYVRKRDCYNQLKGFMQHEYPGKICALYGLRRTGKTVMMYQYISELSDKDKEKTVYILCLRECDMLELRQAMEDFLVDEDMSMENAVLVDYVDLMAEVEEAGDRQMQLAQLF